MGLKTLAKYPFLSDAKKYVDSLNLRLEELPDHPIYSGSIALGRERIMGALNDQIAPDLESELGMELTILSYPIARLLVNLTQNSNLINRYALGESKRAYKFLKTERDDVVNKIMGDLDFRVEDGKIDFGVYIKLMADMAKRQPKFKIVNRTLESGKVHVGGNETNMLIREAIRLKVAEPVDVKLAPESLKKMAKPLGNIALGKPDIKLDSDMKNLPPCIKLMLKHLEMGEASHNVMFILGTFFTSCGLDTEKILAIFSRYPNFSDEKTRYQLQFLSGERGGTKYSCPSCSKIRSYGLCPADCGVKHPAQYVRRQSSTHTS